MSLLSLLIGIALLIVLSYKGVQTFLSALISCLVILLLNGFNVWDGLSQTFASGFVGFLKSYILLLTAGAMFGRLISKSGCARAFALKLLDWFGEKNIILVLIVATSIFALCGINIYIIFFAVYPIAVVIGHRQNISKGVLASAMWAMAFTVAFPGAISFNNIICSSNMGTKFTAGLWVGIAGSLVTLAIGVGYTLYINRRYKRLGIGFEPGPQDHVYLAGEMKDEDLPHWITGVIPLAVVAVVALTLSNYFDAVFSAVIATLLASLIIIILNFKRLKKDLLRTMGEGLMEGFGPLLTISSLVGFGAVVQLTPGFAQIVDAALNMNTNPYMTIFLSTNLLVGITGSISGGLGIYMNTLAPALLEMGVNAQMLHRITAMSACGLDSLPHSAGIIGQLSVMQLSVKQGYKHAFVQTVVATTAGAFVTTLLAMIFY